MPPQTRSSTRKRKATNSSKSQKRSRATAAPPTANPRLSTPSASDSRPSLAGTALHSSPPQVPQPSAPAPPAAPTPPSTVAPRPSASLSASIFSPQDCETTAALLTAAAEAISRRAEHDDEGTERFAGPIDNITSGCLSLLKSMEERQRTPEMFSTQAREKFRTTDARSGWTLRDKLEVYTLLGTTNYAMVYCAISEESRGKGLGQVLLRRQLKRMRDIRKGQMNGRTRHARLYLESTTDEEV
jgi:hypothetical protein